MGQRNVRQAATDSSQEPSVLAAIVVLVFLVLIPTAWHSRQSFRVPVPQKAFNSPYWLSTRARTYGPLLLTAAAVGLGYLFPPEFLVAKSWLALALLASLGALGIIYAYGEPRLGHLWPSAQFHHWGTGLLFFFGAFFFRILFVGPAVPNWEQVSALQSLTGTLYRILGEQRAVLVPITLSCLLPVAVWWVSRGLAGPRVALAAGLLTILQPYAIWSAEFATSLGLSPFLMLLLIAVAHRAWRTQLVGAWLWTGLLWGLLWVESSPVRFLLLVWLVALSLMMLRNFRPGRNLRLSLNCGLWVASGLFTGLFLWGEPWSNLFSLNSSGGNWAVSPHLSQLMTFWFQPHVLNLPHAMTLFLPVDGILMLLGIAVCMAIWPRTPILAVAALGWLVAFLWPTPEGARMLEIFHVTLGLSMLLAAVGIGLFARLAQELVKETTPRVQEVLPWTAALFLAIQFPGGVLGENPAMNLIQGLRGVQAPTAFQTEMVHSLQPVPVNDSPAEWQTELVWRSEGVCEVVSAVTRGVAIDLKGQQVWVSGGQPGFLMSLDLATGHWTGKFYNAGLSEPADILLRDSDELYLIDAVNNQVMRFQPSTGTLTGLNSSSLLSWPRGFAEGPDGGFLVADTAHSRISHFDADGDFLSDLRQTPGSLHIVQPTDVLTVGGKIWVVDPEDAVLIEMTEGLSVDVVQKGWTFNGPHMEALPDESFLLSDPIAGQILHLTSTGNLLSRVVLPENLLYPVALDTVALAGGQLLAVTEDASCETWLLHLEKRE